MALPKWSDQQVINQLNSGSTWPDQVITYAYPQLASDYGSELIPALSDAVYGFSPISAVQFPLLDLSVQLWDELIASTIRQGPVQTANILIGNTSNTDGYAFAMFPEDGGSVWFSSHFKNLQQPVIGEDSFITYVHEVGHALGLDHMGDYNGDDDDGPSSFQDSDMLSIMSYYGPGMERGKGDVAWGNWKGADGVSYSAQTPMVNDIMVIQEMYGANTSTRAGNTTYGFGSNVEGSAAQIYDFSINKNPILTIYDAGGIDTLDLSGWGSDGLINLNPGQYSSVNGMTNNIAIAWGVTIENAVAGAGNDILIGNSANNYLDGGAGIDSAVFSGNLSSYDLSYDLLSREYAVVDTRGIDGTDTLINIEYANFNGMYGDLNDLTPAVYRFYNTELSQHFYTANNDEATAVINAHDFVYEGVGFNRSVNDPNAVSVQRFFNNETSSHFYTADEAEAAHLRELNGAWQYEGVAFSAYDNQVEGTVELHRFVNNESGAHFYTSDAAEMEAVMLSGYFDYEGIAFYIAV